MGKTTEQLEQDWQTAETEAIRIQNEKDDALEKVRAKYTQRQQAAVNKAANAQKAFLDAQAADALRDRPEGAAIAEALGLTL